MGKLRSIAWGNGCQSIQELCIGFVVYENVSDKHSDSVVIPEGGSFYDMVKLKNQDGIGDKMNTVITTFAEANALTGIIDVADFDDDDMLGKDKDKKDKFTKTFLRSQNSTLVQIVQRVTTYSVMPISSSCDILLPKAEKATRGNLNAMAEARLVERLKFNIQKSWKL